LCSGSPCRVAEFGPESVECAGQGRVISAQSANVDLVSGATYTSQGYLRSLQSALDRLS
jgi:uncharacterized protein with FMN-binding domain